jgi:hypothetical protein
MGLGKYKVVYYEKLPLCMWHVVGSRYCSLISLVLVTLSAGYGLPYRWFRHNSLTYLIVLSIHDKE